MPEHNSNLWAPWRSQYIRSLGESSTDGSCFLCDYLADEQGDDRNHVICRTTTTVMVMNLFPYTNGHLLIAPVRHLAELDDLNDEELLDLNRLARDGIKMLKTVVSAQGFNVGMNFGRCAGAGLPDHLHAHLVPRWNGDTNFMSTVGEARVVPESLDEVFERLRNAAREMGLA